MTGLAEGQFRRTQAHSIDRILANGLPYSRKLSAHRSCVNALAFQRDGRFLASAGDDLMVHLWDFHQDDLQEPSLALKGPQANVFTLAWSCTGRTLYTAGVDSRVLQHDLASLNTDSSVSVVPNRIFNPHEDTVRALSCHPSQESVLLSASDDGRIILHDMRDPQQPLMTTAQRTMQLKTENTDVKFHPLMEHIFATSDARTGLKLRDTRMAFGPARNRCNSGEVMSFCHVLSKRGNALLARPEISSFDFNPEGNRIVTTVLGFNPTIYALDDPIPLGYCTSNDVGRTLGYMNHTTIKHGAIGRMGSANNEYFCAGSDDFRAYVWQLPSPQELLDGRREVSPASWLNEADGVIGFLDTSTGHRYVPTDLSSPLCRLTGHKTIVNCTIFHPHFYHVVTAGVENSILVHSPTPSGPFASNFDVTPTAVRERALKRPGDIHEMMSAMASDSHLTLRGQDSTGEDTPEARTIRMFDIMLNQEEGDRDIFSRGNIGSDNSSDDEGYHIVSDSEDEELMLDE